MMMLPYCSRTGCASFLGLRIEQRVSFHLFILGSSHKACCMRASTLKPYLKRENEQQSARPPHKIPEERAGGWRSRNGPYCGAPTPSVPVPLIYPAICLGILLNGASRRTSDRFLAPLNSIWKRKPRCATRRRRCIDCCCCLHYQCITPPGLDLGSVVGFFASEEARSIKTPCPAYPAAFPVGSLIQ